MAAGCIGGVTALLAAIIALFDPSGAQSASSSSSVVSATVVLDTGQVHARVEDDVPGPAALLGAGSAYLARDAVRTRGWRPTHGTEAIYTGLLSALNAVSPPSLNVPNANSESPPPTVNVPSPWRTPGAPAMPP